MLTLYHGGQEHPIQNTEYYIRELATGLDEIVFDISIWDPIYQMLAEEDNIVDRGGQRYLVKQIDGGAVTAKVVCQLDLDEWRSTLSVGYDSGSKTVLQQIQAVAPQGWTVQDGSGISISRTLHGDYTPLQVCQACTGVYQVYIRWDNRLKICRIYPKAMADPVGSFATRELNLKEINYKGKSNDFATRLYAYGKDGLTLQGQTIHGQVYPYPYVDDNTYSSRVICAYWQDDRYTDVESLYDDAVEKLAVLAVPERSYDCSIVDLQATNPEKYNNLDFSLFTTATLIDDVKESAVNYQVVERHVWPYHPDRNDVIFDNSPLKITTTVVQIQDAIDNPNSTFQQIWTAKVQAATDWLLSGDGYVVAVKGNDGEWKELLFMDTNDVATAQKVIRINENGIGFSRNGVNGPYENAWTIDGSLNASFITSGTLDADQVTVHGRIQATSGYIGSGTGVGWIIGSDNLHNGPSGLNDSTDGVYMGTDGFRCNGDVYGTPGGYVKINGGVLSSNTVINAAGFNAGRNGDFFGEGVYADKYYVNNVSGKSTGSFSVQVYVGSELKWVGLNFTNGILTGVSNF